MAINVQTSVKVIIKKCYYMRLKQPSLYIWPESLDQLAALRLLKNLFHQYLYELKSELVRLYTLH